jgi:hypothetical protein
VAVLTLKKYKSFCNDMFLFICPEKTSARQTSEASVSAMGTKMHAKRPAFPIVSGLREDLARVGGAGATSQGRETGSDRVRGLLRRPWRTEAWKGGDDALQCC